MHRNCHLDRAFSLLPRRRLGRMNAADRPTNDLVDSQTSDVGSIPIARSITHDDSIGLTHLKLLNLAKNGPVLDPNFPRGSSDKILVLASSPVHSSACLTSRWRSRKESDRSLTSLKSAAVG